MATTHTGLNAKQKHVGHPLIPTLLEEIDSVMNFIISEKPWPDLLLLLELQLRCVGNFFFINSVCKHPRYRGEVAIDGVGFSPCSARLSAKAWMCLGR